jgi:hypothetical protein
MKKLVALFFILIIAANIACAQRVRIGLSQVGMHADDKKMKNITQCEYQTDCKEENLQYKNDYFVALDFEPNYLVGGLGVGFSFIPRRNFKVRLVDYPNDNESLDLSVSTTALMATLFYNIGDKYWDKQDITSLKIGLNYSTQQREVSFIYNEKSYSQKDTLMNSAGYFISYDAGNFSLMAREMTDHQMIWLDDSIDYSLARGNGFRLKYVEYTFAYSIYF